MKREKHFKFVQLFLGQGRAESGIIDSDITGHFSRQPYFIFILEVHEVPFHLFREGYAALDVSELSIFPCDGVKIILFYIEE